MSAGTEGLLARSVKFDRYLLPATGTAGTGMATLGAAGGIAVAYFLDAQLGLSLLATPSDVAVFWPASGLAAGILIAAGRRAGLASVLGIVLGTVAANLLSDRSLSTSILKGFCNAGKPYWWLGCLSGGSAGHSPLAIFAASWASLEQQLSQPRRPPSAAR